MDAERPQAPLAPREGRWMARPLRANWAWPVGFAAVVITQIPTWGKWIAEIWLSKDEARAVWWALLIVEVSLAALFVVRERLSRRMREADRVMLDANFGDQFPAEVTVVVDGRRLGADRGVVWFADGLMGFSGAASSFVLAARDVKSYPEGRAAKDKVPAYPVGTLRLIGTDQFAYLVVHGLGPHAKPYLARLKQFEDEEADPAAERFWPPLVPYEAAPVEAKALA